MSHALLGSWAIVGATPSTKPHTHVRNHTVAGQGWSFARTDCTAYLLFVTDAAWQGGKHCYTARHLATPRCVRTHTTPRTHTEPPMHCACLIPSPCGLSLLHASSSRCGADEQHSLACRCRTVHSLAHAHAHTHPSCTTYTVHRLLQTLRLHRAPHPTRTHTQPMHGHSHSHTCPRVQVPTCADWPPQHINTQPHAPTAPMHPRARVRRWPPPAPRRRKRPGHCRPAWTCTTTQSR